MEMTHSFDAAVIIGLALIIGTVAQIIARHIHIPGIVLLLAAGALLGPDFADLIQPDKLGSTLQMLVGFAIAVILFEGGMNLNFKRIIRESRTIQQLITIGAIITGLGASLAAHYILDWNWEMSVLFGSLVIVTGPTVIAPILKRIKLNHNIATILEAEGILSDPIGAIIAIVTLHVITHPAASFFSGLIEIVMSLGVGVVNGLIGGFLVVLLLKPKRLIPDGMANIFVLTFALALFQISNFLQAESGLGAVTVAGLVVGNFKTRSLEDLKEFKEQLTTMLIGMLFVLLAADVRVADITNLGWGGIYTVAAMILIVRPLNIIVGTSGSDLKFKEKLFLSWMAPRGIIAAAVASYFAIELAKVGIDGGNQIRAMVFLVIIVTVVLNGLTGAPLASLLKIRRKSNSGYICLGANSLSIKIGQLMTSYNESITFIDSNADASKAAESAGLKVIFGNGLEERTLLRSSVDTMSAAIGLTPNEEVNLLFTSRCHKHFKVPKQYIALHLNDGHITDEMVDNAGAEILFGRSHDINLWSIRIQKQTAVVESWRMASKEDIKLPDESLNNSVLPLFIVRSEKVVMINSKTEFKKDDLVLFLIFEEQRDPFKKWLADGGWVFEQKSDPPKEKPKDN